MNNTSTKSVVYNYQSNDINKLRELSKDMASKAYMLSTNQSDIEYSSVITSLPTGNYQLIFVCHN